VRPVLGTAHKISSPAAGDIVQPHTCMENKELTAVHNCSGVFDAVALPGKREFQGIAQQCSLVAGKPMRAVAMSEAEQYEESLQLSEPRSLDENLAPAQGSPVAPSCGPDVTKSPSPGGTNPIDDPHGSDSSQRGSEPDEIRGSGMAVGNMLPTCTVLAEQTEKHGSPPVVAASTGLQAGIAGADSKANADDLAGCTVTCKAGSDKVDPAVCEPCGDADNALPEPAVPGTTSLCIVLSGLDGDIRALPQGVSDHGPNAIERRDTAGCSGHAEVDATESKAAAPQAATCDTQTVVGALDTEMHPPTAVRYVSALPQGQSQPCGRRRGKRVRLDPAFVASQDHANAKCLDAMTAGSDVINKQADGTKTSSPHFSNCSAPQTDASMPNHLDRPDAPIQAPISTGLPPSPDHIVAALASDACPAGDDVGTQNIMLEDCQDVCIGHKCSPPLQLTEHTKREPLAVPFAGQRPAPVYVNLTSPELARKADLNGLHCEQSITPPLLHSSKEDTLCKAGHVSACALPSEATCHQTLELNSVGATSEDDVDLQPSPGPWFVSASALLHSQRSRQGLPNSASQSALSPTSATPFHLDKTARNDQSDATQAVLAASDEARMPCDLGTVQEHGTSGSKTTEAAIDSRETCHPVGDLDHGGAAQEGQSKAHKSNVQSGKSAVCTKHVQ
jgi:hypothetical protein